MPWSAEPSTESTEPGQGRQVLAAHDRARPPGASGGRRPRCSPRSVLSERTSCARSRATKRWRISRCSTASMVARRRRAACRCRRARSAGSQRQASRSSPRRGACAAGAGTGTSRRGAAGGAASTQARARVAALRRVSPASTDDVEPVEGERLEVVPDEQREGPGQHGRRLLRPAGRRQRRRWTRTSRPPAEGEPRVDAQRRRAEGPLVALQHREQRDVAEERA